MPEHSLYSDEQNPQPIFARRRIDTIRNLKVGDYLVEQRDIIQEDGHPSPIYGQTRAWDITRITKKCVYISYAKSQYNYQEIRLAWKDITTQNALYRGYLENNSYQLYFHEYVKQEDMTLEPFRRG